MKSMFLVVGVCLGLSGCSPFLSFAQKLRPELLLEAAVEEKVIALTFDDGPSPSVLDQPDVLLVDDTTSQILTLLSAKDYQVDGEPHKATFFLCAGEIQENEKTVQKMVGLNHELGNHMMWNYPSKASYVEQSERFWREFLQADRILRRYERRDTLWFRPAYGKYCKEWVSDERFTGYHSRLAMASLVPTDVKASVDAEEYAALLIRNLKPGRIFVMHDTNQLGKTRVGEKTVTALKILLMEMKKQGYRSVTLSELQELERKALVK